MTFGAFFWVFVWSALALTNAYLFGAGHRDWIFGQSWPLCVEAITATWLALRVVRMGNATWFGMPVNRFPAD